MSNEESPKNLGLDDSEFINDHATNKQNNTVSGELSHVLSLEKNHEGVPDIEVQFVNDKLIHLKELLYCVGGTFTPKNINDFVADQLNKHSVDKKVFLVVEELNRLLKEECFDAQRESNTPWIWAINLLTQLKFAFEIKRKKILKKLEKKLQKQTQKTKKNVIPFNISPLINPSSLPETSENFDSLVEKADKLFELRGPEYFQKAKIIYQQVLAAFPVDKDIGYVKDQIVEIDRLLNEIFGTFTKPQL